MSRAEPIASMRNSDSGEGQGPRHDSDSLGSNANNAYSSVAGFSEPKTDSQRLWSALLRSEEPSLATGPRGSRRSFSFVDRDPTRLRKGVGDHPKFLTVDTNILATAITQTFYTLTDFSI